MSYATNLAASQQEATPEFYKIAFGTTLYYYTTYKTALTFLGHTYSPASIKRGGFSYDDEFGATQVTVTAAIDSFWETYIANQPIEPVNIKIYRALASDTTDYNILFNGQVKNVSIQNHQVTATCSARSVYLEKRIPHVIYQSYCNHDIFDSGCSLSKYAWEAPGTVVTASGSTLQADEWKAFDDNYFRGGIAEHDGDNRLITGNTKSTGVITLQIPFDSRVHTGVVVNAYPGCDGAPSTCINKFNNLLKFLAMPYIPSKNPVLWGFR